MKKILFYIAAVLLIACSSTRGISNSDTDKKIAVQFKIKKIKWIKNKYIIYAMRNDSTFKIVSREEGIDTIAYPRERIRTGEYYSLNLEKFYPHDSLLGIPCMLNLAIVEAFGIRIEGKCHYSLYHAKNLNGLYIENSTQ